VIQELRDLDARRPSRLEIPDRPKGCVSEMSMASTAVASNSTSQAEPDSETLSELSSVPENLTPIRGLRFSSEGRPSKGFAEDWTVSRRPSDTLILKDLGRHYDLGKRLGEGRFGKVRQVKCKSTGKMFALKTLTSRGSAEAEVEAELAAGSEFDHPYVVKLHGFFSEGDFYHLVMDLCTGGDLMACVQSYVEDRLRDDAGYDSGLPTDVAAGYTWQMLNGLTFLHHHGFIHRDVKPENYLLAHRGPQAPIKLADFGCACRLGRKAKLTRQVGTVFYMAPELLEESYDQKVDVWSLGVTCFAICTNGLPFEGDGKDYIKNVQKRRLIDYKPAWEPHTSVPRLREVIFSMMQWDPSKRPSAKALSSDNLWLKAFINKANKLGSPGAPGTEGCCTIS